RLHRPEGAKATFDVLGLEAAELAQLAKAKLEPGQWAALFAVYVENETKAERPAVLGTYRIDNDVIHFEPQFPLTPGLRYKAVLDLSRLPGRAAGKPEPTVAEFSIPKSPASPTTVIQQIYPTANKLPENQFRFYIHFSAPMSRGEAYQHIQLLTAAGKPVEQAFLELNEELWDPEMRRLT